MTDADITQALRILNRRLILALAIACRAIDWIMKDSGLFLSAQAKTLVQEFYEQYDLIQNTIAHSKEINHG